MNLEKIDAQGRYCNYPGITIIAKINQKDENFWQKVQQIISQPMLAKQYYTPLPYQSYHMTTIRLFNRAECGQADWQALLISYKPFFKKLFDYLQQNQFTPEITLQEVSISETLHLSVSFPTNQNEHIMKMAEEFDLLGNIHRPFHITFGYLYKDIPLAHKQSLLLEINENLDSLFRHNGRLFTLNSPSLCIYKDMTNFLDWNGEKHPF
ncbi:Uncharacterized protein conserved in bacteria [Legionella busanensis]|uniref:Uncharacterized protein conserved in bacteria n=1 Tax=Legionella busanensis TaxID=190655 RepID=A0A378JSX2_9GAMM|nr:DUF1868 domain-containing protein [Legionella busanensis]STX51262.1 Uncharacterized protein conserved in bacteria [Legionella busanensis]